jgi:hypothetical protein
MPLRIDTDALLAALEDHGPGVVHYLDLQTGEVVPASSDAFGAAGPEYATVEWMEDDPRFLAVEPVSSRTGWEWMREFAEQVKATNARDELYRAIQKDRPFRRFKDALLAFPAVREQWFLFHEAKMLGAAREWLEAAGIEGDLARSSGQESALGLAE